MSTPTIDQRCDAQDWVHRYSGHSHLLTAAELRTVLVENEELKRKVENQRERIVYLEGATSHACGTPLSVALRERDQARDAERLARVQLDLARKQRDQWRECARELRAVAPSGHCPDFHHARKDRHEIGETCPCEVRYRAMLARFDAAREEAKP